MATVGMRLVEGLAARGVRQVFGIPGVHTVELYRGLAGSGLRHVTARHEQGAAFMADGYARVSGQPGVAFVITGPGLTNALTAMAQARAESVPMLVVSGVNRQSSLGLGLGHLHELPDQAAMVRALCPSLRVTGPDTLGPVLDRAFALMLGERPGPVHIEVPTDVMAMDCAALAPPLRLPTLAPDAPSLMAAARMLDTARRPVILAGGGAKTAAAALRDLAERLDAPVVQTVNARGLVFGHPLSVPASPSLAAVRRLVADADLVLAVGTELGPTDYDMYAAGGFPDLSGMIRIDICPQQLARHPAALRLHAPADLALAALSAQLAPRHGNGGEDGASRAQATRASARAELAGLHPAMPGQLAMVEAIRSALPGALIIGDSTQPVYAANLFYDHDRPGGWFNAATGYGALGFAPGAAIGAALAAPGVPVVCLIGDGGLQFSAAELRTARDEALPIRFVVWNNNGYREIAEAMAGAGAQVIGCDPSSLQLEALAAACGLPFASLPFASLPADAQALTDALRAPVQGPCLIELRAG